jgi:S-adenosylmethionine hydrolase
MTDFKLRDPYISALKGVLLNRNPNLQIIDVAHELPNFSIAPAQFLLAKIYNYFPSNTIFVVVVDPGVGSSRSIICIDTGDYIFIAPDNGALSFLKQKKLSKEIRIVENEKYFSSKVSNTFHGRDIMVPVAAHISRGLPLDKLGKRTDSIVVSPLPLPKVINNSIHGEVIYIDGYGNLVSNIDQNIVKYDVRRAGVDICGAKIYGISSSYSAVGEGELLAIFNSFDSLEISVNKGSAEKLLNAGIGDRVIVNKKNTKSTSNSMVYDKIWMVETNIDDVSGQIVGYVFEKLVSSGALDVYVTPVQMKKNRPGFILSCLATQEKLRSLEEIIFKETGTLGIRKYQVDRTKLVRDSLTVSTRFGRINVKKVSGFGEIRLLPEYEDCKRVARREGFTLDNAIKKIKSEM